MKYFCYRCGKTIDREEVIEINVYCPNCSVKIRNIYCLKCAEQLVREISDKLRKKRERMSSTYYVSTRV